MLEIRRFCGLLNVSRASYYRWCSLLDERKLEVAEEKELYLKILNIFTASRKSYGVPRVWRQLIRNGVACSRREVARIMRKNKLISVHCRRKRGFVSTTDSSKTKAPAENLLARNFFADAPNLKWVGDITFVRTPEGWLYLATVMDLFSRKIVGYALDKHIDAKLACDAFMMALARRQQPKQLIYHSDRGRVYDSNDFKLLLAKNEIIPSMSRKGNCWDNAVAESFFHTLKVEFIYQVDFGLMLSYKAGIIGWIENFYNSKRMHSSIEYRSPDEFEAMFANSK